MKKIMLVLSASFILAAGIVIIAPSAQAKTSDPRKPIYVESGGIFIITLESNRTTGYEWQVAKETDPSVFEVVGVEYVKPTSSLAGAGGVENLTFRALSSRRDPVPLTLGYVRPWEKDTPPAKEVTFFVVITKGKEERQLDSMQRSLDEMHRESMTERISR